MRGLPSPPSLVSPSWFLQLRPLTPSNCTSVCAASCPPWHSGLQQHGISCLSLLPPGPVGGRSGPRHQRPGKCPQPIPHALPSASPKPGVHPFRNHRHVPISQREHLRLERRLRCPSSHRETNRLTGRSSRPVLARSHGVVPATTPCSTPSPTTLASF